MSLDIDWKRSVTLKDWMNAILMVLGIALAVYGWGKL